MSSDEPQSKSDISRLLNGIRDGDGGATDRLASLVYDELRGMAGAIFNGGDPRHTLQPTALVHEAWLKLAGSLNAFESRSHFLAVAAKAMRQVLADHARTAKRQKRGGNLCHAVTLCDTDAFAETATVDLADLHENLERLARLNERHARVVELRLFGSLTIDETADLLGLSPRTVQADWTTARAWLRRELLGGR